MKCERELIGEVLRTFMLVLFGRGSATGVYRDAVSNLLDTAASSGAANTLRGGNRTARTPKGKTDEG